MSTEEEEDAFFERLRNKRESNKKLYEENIKLKNENNKLTDDNIKLRNEIKKLKDEIIKLNELNKETEHEPEKIVDAGIMKIECVEVTTIETKDDRGDMKIENLEGKAIGTQNDNEIPKIECVEGKTIETKSANGMVKAIETKEDKGDMKIENVEDEAIETKDENGITENKSDEETQGIKNHESITEKRGLVVICTHHTFDNHNILSERPGAYHDLQLMKNVWEKFECKVVEFEDKQTSFYKDELTKAIEAELKNIPDSKFFVFVLSTHGTTHEAADVKSTKHSSPHMFYTKDAQFGTIDLMENISGIKMLKTKPKIFVIQACRSKAQGVNVDLGHLIEITRFGGKNTDNTKNLNDLMVLEVGKEKIMNRIFTGTSKEVSSNDNLPIEDIPLCEESVLLFATTPGKFAYQITHDDKPGGLAIRALHTIMTDAEVGAKLHITDILTRVNYEVQKKQILCRLKPGVPLTPNLVFADKMTEIDCQQRLENHVIELIQLCNLCISSAEIEEYIKEYKQEKIKKYKYEEITKYKHEEIKKYTNELEALRERISNKNNTKDILSVLKDELNKTSNLITDILKYIPIKCQSCFYHNLSIDTDEVYFAKVK